MEVRARPQRRLSIKELMLSNCGAGEDSWESLGQQGAQTWQSYRKSALNIHWKDWCRSSNTLATWHEEPTHWKKSWCWERWGQEEKRVTEDEMVGWHHQLNDMSLSKLWEIVKDRELTCCSPWGRKELDTTYWLKPTTCRQCPSLLQGYIEGAFLFSVAKINCFNFQINTNHQ